VKECGDGMFTYVDGHDNHASCQHCHPSCLSCFGEKDNQCLKCPEFMELVDGKCNSTCPPG